MKFNLKKTLSKISEVYEINSKEIFSIPKKPYYDFGAKHYTNGLWKRLEARLKLTNTK